MSDLIKSYKCPNCNGNLELDLDKIGNYCKYCGTPIMLNISTIKELLIEKEKTKQILETEKEKTKQILESEKAESERVINDNKTTAMVFIAFLAFGAFGLLMFIFMGILF